MSIPIKLYAAFVPYVFLCKYHICRFLAVCGGVRSTASTNGSNIANNDDRHLFCL